MTTQPTRVVLVSCGGFNPINFMHLRMFELARDHMNSTGRYRIIGGIISPMSIKLHHKDATTMEQRCSMIKQSLATSSWIRLDTWAADQQHHVNTLTLLRHHFDVIETTLNFNQLDPYTPTKRKCNGVFKYTSADDPLETTASQQYQQRATHGGPSQTHHPPYHHPYHQTKGCAEGSVELMLLCGADVLHDFNEPNLWNEKEVEEIVSNFGLVVISRMGYNPQHSIYDSDVLSKYKNNIHIVPDWIANDMSSTRIRTAIRRKQSVKYLLPEQVIDYIGRNHLYTPIATKTPDAVSPNTTADVMLSSSYSAPSYHGYSSTSNIVDAFNRAYQSSYQPAYYQQQQQHHHHQQHHHQHQPVCRPPYNPSDPIDAYHSHISYAPYFHQQPHCPLIHPGFTKRRGVSTPRSLAYGVTPHTNISKQPFGRSKSLDIDSANRPGPSHSSMAGSALAALSTTPSGPLPSLSGVSVGRKMSQQQSNLVHHKNLNFDEEYKRKGKKDSITDTLLNKLARTVRRDSKDQQIKQQQQQQPYLQQQPKQQHKQSYQHQPLIVPQIHQPQKQFVHYQQYHPQQHLQPKPQQQQQHQQQHFLQQFRTDDLKERSGSIVSAIEGRKQHPTSTTNGKNKNKKNYSLDSELDHHHKQQQLQQQQQQQQHYRSARIFPPIQQQQQQQQQQAHQSAERLSNITKAIKGVRLTPETCV